VGLNCFPRGFGAVTARDGVGFGLEFGACELVVDFVEGGGMLAFFFFPDAEALDRAVGAAFAPDKMGHFGVEGLEILPAFAGVFADGRFDFGGAGEDEGEELGFDADDLAGVNCLPVDRFPVTGLRQDELHGQVGEPIAEQVDRHVVVDQVVDPGAHLEVVGVGGAVACEIDVDAVDRGHGAVAVNHGTPGGDGLKSGAHGFEAGVGSSILDGGCGIKFLNHGWWFWLVDMPMMLPRSGDYQ
jgi:hypothetical protein